MFITNRQLTNRPTGTRVRVEVLKDVDIDRIYKKGEELEMTKDQAKRLVRQNKTAFKIVF